MVGIDVTKKINYSIGDILEVESFAGKNIQKKVLKKIDYVSQFGKEKVHVIGFEGCFVRRRDLIALKKSSVPYSGKEKLSECISFTYDWQIVKKIKPSSSKRRCSK